MATGTKAVPCIHGRHLSFVINDAAQGVFLENETGLNRMETYNRHGTNIVEFQIPETLAAGNYSLSLVAKPGNTYFTVNIDSDTVS